MDFHRLDQKISELLAHNLHNQSYSEIREALSNEGFQEQEVQYMMRVIDEKGIIPTAKRTSKSSFTRNILLGAALCLISFVTVISLYLGQKTEKEVYYVAIAIFALGYYILRTGLKKRSQTKQPDSGE